MIPTQLKFAPYKSAIVDLKGGINENVSSLELSAGELIDCKNYMIAEGGYGGYISIKGYERFDGALKPSTYESLVLTISDCPMGILGGQTITDASGSTAIALEDGKVQSGTYLTGDAVVIVQVRKGLGDLHNGEALTTVDGAVGTLSITEVIAGGTDAYHAGIEWCRLQVQEVPGEGAVLGLCVFEGKAYAFRKKVGVATMGMYVEDSNGWLEIDTSGSPLVYSEGAHEFHFTTYNFLATSSSFSLFWVDGVNKARAYDSTTVSIIDNTGMDPNDRPINILAHNFHLFLAYRGGSLQHSKVGDPTVWDGSLGAGEFGCGGEITNMKVGVQSSMVITLSEGIRILTGTTIDDFNLGTFSDKSGAKPKSAQRLLGTIFLLDDRGVTTMEAVQEFGDFGANSISQRFRQSLFKNRHTLTTTLVSRDMNQYRLFFEDKLAIFVSFEGKELRGATLVEYNKVISVAGQGEDTVGREYIIFGDGTTGFVYQMDSGTSFDGSPITCRMSTAYYHYGSPRQLKAFKRATIEVTGDSGQEFDLKVDFDYNEAGSPRTIWYTPMVYTVSGGAIYGEGKWGIMKYGVGAAATNRVPVYLIGTGTNMSYKLISNETYKGQHIVQNIITDYALVGRQV